MDPKESELSRPQSLSCTPEQKGASSSHPFPGLKTPWKQFHLTQTKRLSGIAAKMGVTPDQIDDVVQEVWLDAWKHREGFQGEDVDQRLAACLGIVVVHKAVDSLRRAERRRAESLDDLTIEPTDHGAEDPAGRMKARERDENLAAVLEELRKNDLLNCWLVCEHIMEDRSLGDLAAETGLGVHAISCRVDRTLKKLQIRLHERLPSANATQGSLTQTCRE